MKRISLCVCMFLLCILLSCSKTRCPTEPDMSSGRTWFIEPDGTGDAPTIHAGLDSASYGDTVLVACGTYYEHDIPMKSAIYLRSQSSTSGCATIDAQGLGRVIVCRDLNEQSLIEGFTLTGGNAIGESPDDRRGGGIFCLRSSLVLKRVVFLANEANLSGGGMHCMESSAEVVDVEFRDNSAQWSGGGMTCYSSAATLARVTFEGNDANTSGGMFCWESSAELESCSFIDNSSFSHGAGISCCAGSSSLTDVSFANNEAGQNGVGGGVYSQDDTLTLRYGTFVGNSAWMGAGIACKGGVNVIEHCTFYQNTALQGSGGILRFSEIPVAMVNNTIVAFNPSGLAVSCAYQSAPTLSCCDLYGNPHGDYLWIPDQYGVRGNFSARPSFCNADMGDFHLCDGSPCAPGNHPDGYDCGLVGAWDVGCSCGPTETQPSALGALKAPFR